MCDDGSSINEPAVMRGETRVSDNDSSNRRCFLLVTFHIELDNNA